MIVERDVDCGAVYERQRRELLSLLRDAPENRLAVRVAATPEWSVLDVVAHVTGIAADLNAGHFATGDPDAWTAAQVAARRGRSLAEVAAEWDAAASAFEDGLRLFGYEVGSHFVGDLVQHASDVRHALGLPRVADEEAILVALDFYADSFHQTLLELGGGAADLEAGSECWRAGSGAVVVTVRAPAYELLRALGGRRSDAQLRALDWQGEVDRVLPVMSRYPVPAADLEV